MLHVALISLRPSRQVVCDLVRTWPNQLELNAKQELLGSSQAAYGPKYVIKKGKTPVWSREDSKTLLESIPRDSVSGLRDLALIACDVL